MVKKSACLLLLFCGSALAQENPLSFNYFSASYIDSDADQVSGDGFGVGLGIQLLNRLHATAEFSTREFDGDGSSSDLQFISAGLGSHFALFDDERLTIFGAVTWEQLDIDSSGVGGGGGGGGEPDPDMGDDNCIDPFGIICPPGSAAGKARAKNLAAGEGRLDGLGIQLGVRSLVWRTLELGARIRFRDYGNFDETIYSLSADYGFGGAWSVGVSYDSFDEAELDEIYGTVRYSFGSGSRW